MCHACGWSGVLLCAIRSQFAFGLLVDGPSHVVDAPMVGFILDCLDFGFSGSGSHLFPCFVYLLILFNLAFLLVLRDFAVLSSLLGVICSLCEV